MTDARRAAGDAGWGLACALLLHIILILLTVVWVAFYSHVLEPGHDRAFYEAHAARSGPFVSLIAGGPAFYVVASWVTGRRQSARPAWIAVTLYLLTDVAIFAAMGAIGAAVSVAFLAGAAIKVAGTALGAMRAKR